MMALDLSYTVRPANFDDLKQIPEVEQSAGDLFRQYPDLAHLADDEPTSAEEHNENMMATAKAGFTAGVIVAVCHRKRTLEQNKIHGNNEDSKVVGFLSSTFLALDRGASDNESQMPAQQTNRHDNTANVQAFYLHICELSVHAEHQRRGLAGKMIRCSKKHVLEFNKNSSEPEFGRDKMILGLTLTTFRDLPFNGPFYSKFGFREIPSEEARLNMGPDAAHVCESEEKKFGSTGLLGRRCWMICNASE